jgi:hypothetical protein
MVHVLSSQGKFAELESFLDKRLRVATDPGVTALYSDMLGHLHARLGRWPEAAADYASAIKREPANHGHY